MSCLEYMVVKKRRVYLKLSVFHHTYPTIIGYLSRHIYLACTPMTVVRQSFQHATYAKGYDKGLFSLVANTGVIDCHIPDIGLVCIGSVDRDGIFKVDAGVITTV